MKTVLKISGILIGVFIIGIIALLAIDISNDIEYKVIEKDKQEDSLRIKVETEAAEEKDLEQIVKDVKKESNDVDAVWLWIYKEGKDDLLAKAMIPYNKKGQIMVGADSSDYIFEMTK